MSGKSKFPLIISAADVAKITDLINVVTAQEELHLLDYRDLQTALVLKAFVLFLEENRCPVDFRLEIK